MGAEIPAPPCGRLRDFVSSIDVRRKPSFRFDQGGAAMTEEELSDHVKLFTQRIAEVGVPQAARRSVQELRSAGRRLPWSWHSQPGIYAFVRDGQVVYIGRAAKDTLGRRVVDQLRDRGDLRWNAVLDDPSSLVIVFPFGANDWYWVPSLEVFLIERGAPGFNERRC
jgi:hypothetical protein